jgi:hypothetical protein
MSYVRGPEYKHECIFTIKNATWSQEMQFSSVRHLTKYVSYAQSHGMFCTDILHCLPVIVKVVCGEQVGGSGVMNVTLLLWV